MVAFKGKHPPWVNDPNPEAWVNLIEAAKTFRKHPETMRRLAVSGTIPSYFDGDMWWVRLDHCSKSTSTT